MSTPCNYSWQTKCLLNWNFRIHDWRDHVIHMIFVASQTIVARLIGGVARLAKILFHRAKIGCENLRITLLVTLQVGAALFDCNGRSNTTALEQLICLAAPH